jgi:UDP-glucuronate 4-epimerase
MALSRWARRLLAGEPVQVFGSLNRTRDVTDVEDVAHALVAVAERGAIGTVNIGTGTALTLRQLLSAVEDRLKVSARIELVPAGAEEVAHSLADTSRLASLAGFVPVTDIADVVGRVAESIEGCRRAVRGPGAAGAPPRPTPSPV